MEEAGNGDKVLLGKRWRGEREMERGALFGRTQTVTGRTLAGSIDWKESRYAVRSRHLDVPGVKIDQGETASNSIHTHTQ